MKKIPLRMCVVCREMKEKNNLIRLVLTSNGEINIDETGKMGGRGAYVCKTGCIESALKKRTIERVLGGKLSSVSEEKLKGCKCE